MCRNFPTASAEKKYRCEITGKRDPLSAATELDVFQYARVNVVNEWIRANSALIPSQVRDRTNYISRFLRLPISYVIARAYLYPIFLFQIRQLCTFILIYGSVANVCKFFVITVFCFEIIFLKQMKNILLIKEIIFRGTGKDKRLIKILHECKPDSNILTLLNQTRVNNSVP